MIFGKDGFVRTRPYGRSRICLKARKYRRFGGFKRDYLWLAIGDLNQSSLKVVFFACFGKSLLEVFIYVVANLHQNRLKNAALRCKAF